MSNQAYVGNWVFGTLVAITLISWAVDTWWKKHQHWREVRRRTHESFWASSSRCNYPQDLPERWQHHLHRPSTNVVPLRRRQRTRL